MNHVFVRSHSCAQCVYTSFVFAYLGSSLPHGTKGLGGGDTQEGGCGDFDGEGRTRRCGSCISLREVPQLAVPACRERESEMMMRSRDFKPPTSLTSLCRSLQCCQVCLLSHRSPSVVGISHRPEAVTCLYQML